MSRLLSKRWMSAWGILGCLAVSVCTPRLEIVYCDDVAFEPPLDMTVTALELFGGNVDGRAEVPFHTIDDAEVIEAVRTLLESRLDYWYAPASTVGVAEFMVDLLGPGGRFPLVGVGVNYLETQGCGGTVVRNLAPEDRAVLMNLLFGAPIPGWISG